MAKKSPKLFKTKAIKVDQGDMSFFLTKLRAGVLAEISYASVRGQDIEEGTVQRILNTRRISSIADFALSVGHFPNSIVLNWVNTEHKIATKGDTLDLPVITRSAQLIDGQHRVEGLRSAMSKNNLISELEIPVAIYQNLSTTQCANIFLSINTEQKPVPSSLVYDLYV